MAASADVPADLAEQRCLALRLVFGLRLEISCSPLPDEVLVDSKRRHVRERYDVCSAFAETSNDCPNCMRRLLGRESAFAAGGYYSRAERAEHALRQCLEGGRTDG